MTTWRDEAACQDADPEIFYDPDREGSQGGKDRTPIRARRETALTICATCPSAPDCLKHALEHDEQGIWGGTTEDQRRAIRRGR